MLVFYQNPKKIVTSSSFLFLLVVCFASVSMGSSENTKLSDFTCTPVPPPATSTVSYEIKPALLNLIMKEQFSGVGEDAALHLNNFVELCDMPKYKEVDGDFVKLKLFSSLLETKS